MAEGDTLVNALIGAAVSAVAGAVLPFGPLFGGAVAGYLQGGDRSEGVRIGVIAGLVGFVPFVLLALLVLTVVSTVLVGAGPDAVGMGAFSLFFLLVVLAIGFVYLVGLSALGGWIGNYLKYETDVEV